MNPTQSSQKKRQSKKTLVTTRPAEDKMEKMTVLLLLNEGYSTHYILDPMYYDVL